MTTPSVPSTTTASVPVSGAGDAGEPPSIAFRDGYRALGRYVGSGAPASAVELSDNTNLWGVPPAAARAISGAMGTVTRYPSAYAAGLVEALARYAAVTPEMVVTGCGSDDVLDATMRALAEPGDRVALPDPTFPMAATFARMNGLVPVGIPLTAERAVDVEGLVASGARLIYLASPSNPTGIACTPDALRYLVERAPGFVIVDEAYVEFAGRDAGRGLPLVSRSSRLLVVRTMSKAWGLAGLRVGYGIGQPAVIAEVEKARGPYKVNVLAEQAAIAALREDVAWMAACVAETVANRGRLADALTAVGLAPLPSDANFLLVPTGRLAGGAQALATGLRAHDVGVRPYTGLAGIGDAIRITVGPWPAMERCLTALVAVLAGVLPSRDQALGANT